MRDFARSTGRLAKTDRLDAQVLAHFGEAVRPPMRPLRDNETQVLGAVLARRWQVMNILVAEKNRLSRAAPEVRPRIEAHISWLKQELDDLDTDLQQRIKRSPVWREKDDLLRSVPGVGPQVSLTLLAYLPELGTLNRKQVALWSVWHPSIGTVVHIEANVLCGAVELQCALRCIWEHWWPVGSTWYYAISTSGYSKPESRRR